jgi:hypothetical protein
MEELMAKWMAGTACAAAVLSMSLVAAQTPPRGPAAPTTQTSKAQSSKGRAPDKPTTTSDAAKAPQPVTITGCVVRDAANGGHATIASNGMSYELTGRTDADLEKLLGKRVEATGTLDKGSTGARATSGKPEIGESGAPKEQTATAGQSDVTTTGTPRDNTVPLATDKGTTASLKARLRVSDLKLVSGSCL